MSVFINNLDDFITPSQACINPLVSSKLADSSSSNLTTAKGKITLENDFTSYTFDNEVKPDLIKPKVVNNRKLATVSLNDCLACSGCITSAESILIQEQSYEKVIEKLDQSNMLIVVTLSPQSVASLAASINKSASVTFLLLCSVLKKIGVEYVLDASCGADVSLVEAREEFKRRRAQGSSTQWTSPPLSMPVSSTSVMLPTDNMSIVPSAVIPGGTSKEVAGVPMFCSSCPGWICYAEKTYPQVIPYISTTKSAQQIIGNLIKYRLSILQRKNESEVARVCSSNTGSFKSEVYHVSIQPCFDKKLEASRKDFFDEENNSNEVDLVLSTAELWRLLEALCLNWNNISQFIDPSTNVVNILPPMTWSDLLGTGSSGSSGASEAEIAVFLDQAGMDDPFGKDDIEKLFRSHSADGQHFLCASKESSGSGGYLEYIFRQIALEEYGVDFSDKPLPYIDGRNRDISHVELGIGNLKFAKVYGFRNIQSVVMKMKRGKGCEYDFIEVMACPSGCVNGGGQLKFETKVSDHAISSESPSDAARRVATVENVFHSDRMVRSPEDAPLVRYLYKNTSSVSNETSKTPLLSMHTRYHAIPKLELLAPHASKW